MADERGSDYLAERNSSLRARRIRRMEARRDLMQTMITQVGLGHSEAAEPIERMISERLQEAYDLMCEYLRARGT